MRAPWPSLLPPELCSGWRLRSMQRAVSPAESAQQSGRTSPGRRAARLHDVLVAGEVALALILLVGCGLTVRSMARLYSVDLGFNTDRLLTVPVTVSLPPDRHSCSLGPEFTRYSPRALPSEPGNNRTLPTKVVDNPTRNDRGGCHQVPSS
jgi:hypothetical protein